MSETQSFGDLFICGGCNAKIGPGNLSKLLNQLPKTNMNNLLVGYDATDDAAVIQLTDEVALIQTLDFFPTMVSDPYLFGQIAATNALSDVYAMGGEVISALNIVCFPEELDLTILAKILKGGAEKVKEAGGSLAGGHSIHDKLPKYGLSVAGTVHPDKILKNNTCQVGDQLILTKPLGVGIITTAYSVGETTKSAFQKAVNSMTTLNKYAADIIKKYPVTSCTDITGFGLLGHLSEMVGERFSAKLYTEDLPYIEEAYKCAEEFLITAGGQRNRNYLAKQVAFEKDDYAMEELLFDPQTSGGLLISVPANEVAGILQDMESSGVSAAKIGEIIPRTAKTIYIK